MNLKTLLAACCFVLFGFLGQGHAQVLPLPSGCGTGNITNNQGYMTESTDGKLCVNATVTASVSGFTPSLSYATLTASGSSGSVALPTNSGLVAFQNTGTTTVSCTLGVGSATAATSEIQVPASSTVFVVPGSNTFGACIDQTGSTSNVVVLAGGSGLGTGFGGGGGGSGGGGAVTLASGAVASGAYSAGSIAAGAFVSGSVLSGAFAAGSIVDLVTNGATSAHTCSTGGYSVLGCLGQIDDDVKGPIAAGSAIIGKVGIDQTTPGTTNGVQDAATGSTGASAPTKALEAGGIAQNTEATAVTNGQLKSFVSDLVGRIINFPYANKENAVYGTVTLSATTASTQIVAAQGASTFIYLTSLQCINSDSTNDTLITFQNGSGGSTVWSGSAAHNSGGFAPSFPMPLGGTTVISSNTGLFVKAGTSVTQVICNVQGFKGT